MTKKNFFSKSILKYLTVIMFVSVTSAKAVDCYIAAGQLNFGLLSEGKNLESVGEITVLCSNMKGDVNYTLMIDNNGKPLSLDQNTKDKIFYKLFTSANRSVEWNKDNPIFGVVKNIGGNGQGKKPIYGRILNYTRKLSAGDYNNVSNVPTVSIDYK
jgi:spore coat protein U-like protein